MKYYLSKIQLEKIQSYYNREVLPLSDNDKFILIDGKNISNENGSNGTGKSTLFKCIIYGFGINQRIPKTIVSKNEEYGTIGLEITNNDESNPEKIIIKRKISSTQSQNLYVSVNNVTMNFQRVEYFKKFFEDKILGCSIDIYKYLKIFTQENPCFIRQVNSGIITIFEQIFKIDKLNIYYNKQNQELNNIEKEISKLELYNDKELQEIEKLEKQIMVNTQTTDIDSKIASITNEIKQIEKSISNTGDIEKLKKDYLEQESKSQELLKTNITLNAEIANIEKELKKFENLIKGKICPTCLRQTDDDTFIQSVEGLKDSKKHIIIKNKEIIYLNETNKKQIDENNKALKKIFDEYKQSKIILDQKIKNKTVLESTLKNVIQSNKESIQKQINERKVVIQTNNVSLNDLKAKKEIYTYLSQIFSTKSNIRQNLLVDILNNGLKQLLEYYSSFLFNGQKVESYFDNNIFNIGILLEEGNIFKEYELLSQGERKKVEVVFILQMNDLVNSFYDLNLNLFVFDEFLDNLDYNSTNQILELLNNYAVNNDQMIFITSHKTDINLTNCTLVNIEKENEVSKIQEIIQK